MNPKKRLAIVSTHPIQYYAPVFRELAASSTIQPKVFYTWSQTAAANPFDVGFGAEIKWDIPLLDGYDHEFVPNVAAHPGSSHFWGIRNPDLRDAIERWRAEAVLVYAWNLFSHLRAILYFKGHVPVLFRGDSTLLADRSPVRGAARKLFLKWVYRHVDVAISVGSNNRDYFEWCGVPSSRIAFAPHSVDTHRFADDDGEHERRALQWRTGLGIPDDALVIAYAAKLTEQKNPLLLFDAFMRLSGKAHLVFVGSGPLEPALRARAAAHPRVHFLPFQNQSLMPTVYRVGDVFVLPSRGESWGLALNEALASGRPVIASSKVGAARDLIEPGINGWVFDKDDRAKLTQALQTAMRMDRTGLRRMGETGRRLIQSWSTGETARRIEDIVISS